MVPQSAVELAYFMAWHGGTKSTGLSRHYVATALSQIFSRLGAVDKKKDFLFDASGRVSERCVYTS